MDILRGRAANKGTEHFPCQQCGAVLKYAPGTEHQHCDYCGHENQIEFRAGRVEEYDLQEALRRLQQSTTTLNETHIHCNECGASFQFETNIHADECPFCGTPIVIDTAHTHSIAPKSLLPFKIDEPHARQQFRQWIKGLWFAPNAIKQYASSNSKLTGVYLPFWTFDSVTDTEYRGERGDIYYVTQRVQVSRNNRVVTETRQVPKIRWTPVSGRVGRFFDDVLIGASESLPRKIVDALQPWDLDQLIPYDENYLSGFRSELYQVNLDEGFDYAKQVMAGVIYRDIAQDIGGDHQRIHHQHTRHSRSTYKHCLLPVWSAAFRFKGHSYRFIINGRTGEVQGERPYSGWKIGMAVLTGIVLAGLVYLALEKNGAFDNSHSYQPGQYSQPYRQQYAY